MSRNTGNSAQTCICSYSEVFLYKTNLELGSALHHWSANSLGIIEMKRDRGLKNFDKSGLEGSNKILRTIRLKLARKTSQSANLEDTIRRMWLGSDPKVCTVRMKVQPFCKHCSEHGYSTRYCKVKNPMFGPLSDDDALFES